MSSARYLENQVTSADPLALVVLLYEGAIGAARQAWDCMQEGNIQERSNAISKAMQIVAELQGTLDMENGGEIARSLAELYAFLQERLIAANAEQKAAPLEEVLKILGILNEGWKQIAVEPAAQAPVQAEPVEAGSMAWTM